jgi:hypothetical protein
MASDRDSQASKIAVRVLSAAALDKLCRKYRVQRLDLVGSAVGEAFDQARSDLDFLVIFEPLSPGEYAKAYFSLREALERLSGRPVDLLTDTALTNPYLRRNVDAQRRVLFLRA